MQQNQAAWQALLYKALPFADAVSDELPWSRLLRLSLFQVSCAMALVLLNGTLNRVMIVELNVPAWLVASMVGLPLVIAPLRTLVGFRSDHHQSAIGWRRAPYIWMGSLFQFGGLAIMPFALLLLSGEGNAPIWVAQAAAMLAFLLVGLGLHTTQTAGLALATDIAPEHSRPHVVAVLYIALLLGMLVSALIFGALLSAFTQMKLIQVVQGAAMLTMVLNCIALWKQESRQPDRNNDVVRPAFLPAWHRFTQATRGYRFLVVVALGTAGFTMQDVLLEPYGGEILGLSVGQTTLLTALLATGSLIAFVVAAWQLRRGTLPAHIAAVGIIIGIVAFSIIVFAGVIESGVLFRIGTAGIGFGAGLFSVCTLIMAMTIVGEQHRGLSLGAWGAAQAFAAGLGIAIGGLIRDAVTDLAVSGAFGDVLTNPAVGYSVVYQLEIVLLFATLVALGPLGSRAARAEEKTSFEFTEFPN